jgi:hypothetical protein
MCNQMLRVRGNCLKKENQMRAYKFLDGLNSKFDQIRQQLTQKEPSVTSMEAFMVMVHEESR